MSLFVCFDTLVDQYLARNPDCLLSDVEPVVIDPSNIHVIRGHLLCAAKEIPLNRQIVARCDSMAGMADSRDHQAATAGHGAPNTEQEEQEQEGGFIVEKETTAAFAPMRRDQQSLDSRLWGCNYSQAVMSLRQAGLIEPKNSVHSKLLQHTGLCSTNVEWGCANKGDSFRPSESVMLRLCDPITITVRDIVGNVVDTVGYSRSFYEIYEGAIFLAQGRTYEVQSMTKISAETRGGDSQAFCRECKNISYHTKAHNYTDVNVLHSLTSDSKLFEFGTVKVVRQVHSYSKVDNKSGSVLEQKPLDLAPLEMLTKAVWLDIPLSVSSALEAKGVDPYKAIHTANHVLEAVASLTCSCEGDVETQHDQSPHTRRLLLFDKRPGGLGFCEALLERQEETLDKAVALLTSCPCSHGCPSCTFVNTCTSFNENLQKGGALMLLKLARKKLQLESLAGSSGDFEAEGGSSPRKTRREKLLKRARENPEFVNPESIRPTVARSLY